MEKIILIPGKGFTKYYTEYPTSEFLATSDEHALAQTKAQIVYKESETEDGKPFIILRDRFLQ